jgi:hypothetical protein
MKYGVSYVENPKEYKKLQSRNRRAENPIGYLIRQIKYRARMKGQDFDLVLEELEVPELCPILQIPLFFTPGGRTDNSFSIDRVDNSKGYTKNNCRIISHAANVRKGDLTIEQCERLLAYLKREI